MTDEDKKTRDDWLTSGSVQEQQRRAKALGDFHGRVIAAFGHARNDRIPVVVVEAILRGLAGDQ